MDHYHCSSILPFSCLSIILKLCLTEGKLPCTQSRSSRPSSKTAYCFSLVSVFLFPPRLLLLHPPSLPPILALFLPPFVTAPAAVLLYWLNIAGFSLHFIKYYFALEALSLDFNKWCAGAVLT